MDRINQHFPKYLNIQDVKNIYIIVSIRVSLAAFIEQSILSDGHKFNRQIIIYGTADSFGILRGRYLFVLLRQKTMKNAPFFLRFPSLQGKIIHFLIAITSLNHWFIRNRHFISYSNWQNRFFILKLQKYYPYNASS